MKIHVAKDGVVYTTLGSFKQLETLVCAGRISVEDHFYISGNPQQWYSVIDAKRAKGDAYLTRWIGLIFLALITALIFFAAFKIFSPKDIDIGAKNELRWDAPDQDVAIVRAERIVRNSLKTPSVAKFPTASERVSKIGNSFEISGVVDSQNSFGAMIRSSWEVKLMYQGKGNWKCDYIRIGDSKIGEK